MALDINNILQSLPQVDQSAMPTWARPPAAIAPINVMQQTAPQEPPRQRRSFLDTVGRIADVFAKVGGADALYQPTLDANSARMQQVDLDVMRKQQMQQQLQAGKIGIENDERTRFGQALGGLIGSPDAAALWPQLAEQAGIAPDKAAAIGMAIQQNPSIIEPLAMSFGFTPQKEGSLPSAVQNYAMHQKILAEQGPEAAAQFLQFAQPATVMTPYQEAQVGLRNQEIKSREEIAAANRAATAAAAAAKGTKGDKPGDVSAILRDFNIVLDGKKDPVGDLIRGSTSGYLQTGAAMLPAAVGGTTPGRKNIARLQTIDNALVLALAGGKLGAGVSNADRDFFKEMSGKISDSTIPSAERLAAWDQIKSRLRGIQKRDTPGGSSGNAPRPGTVQQGYRFKGGNPADKNNWVKVR